MDEPIARCANPSYRWPIYKGDQVWMYGHLLFLPRRVFGGVDEQEKEVIRD